MTKFNIAEITISVSDMEENIVGKAKNAIYQHFPLFPQCFQKAFSSGSWKPGIFQDRDKGLSEVLNRMGFHGSIIMWWLA